MGKAGGLCNPAARAGTVQKRGTRVSFAYRDRSHLDAQDEREALNSKRICPTGRPRLNGGGDRGAKRHVHSDRKS